MAAPMRSAPCTLKVNQVFRARKPRDRSGPKSQAPRCSFGYLAAALALRHQRGLPPFTIMSCDNLQNNGDVTRK